MSNGHGLTVLFVNPVLGGDFSALDIGITTVATHVNRHSAHRAAIADLTFHSRAWRRHLRQAIAREQPHVIAISCSALYMKYVWQIVDEAKRAGPLRIAFGGHHATTHAESLFADRRVDALIRGDGEQPFTSYLDRLHDGSGFAGVPGLWVRSADGREVRNEGTGYQSSLDGLPWLDWDLWHDLELYLRFFGMIYVQGSRGCPYRCTFCDAQGYADAIKQSGRYFRLRDPHAFAAELAHYADRYEQRGLRLFQVFDPVFTMDDAWVEAFCLAYRRLGMHQRVRYSVFSRIDHLDEAKVRLLARSGCALLRCGIETGDERIRRDVYHKRIDNAEIRTIVRAAKQHGLDFTAFYIFGGPQETRPSFRSTIRFAWELDAARSAFFAYKPFTASARAQFAAAGGGVDETLLARTDNISFGATTFGRGWGPRTLAGYQFAAYALTFGRRWLRMVRRRGLGYFPAFARYFAHGLWLGLDWRYLAMYFHLYEGDNIDR